MYSMIFENMKTAYNILLNLGDNKVYTFDLERSSGNRIEVVAEDGTRFVHHIQTEEI